MQWETRSLVVGESSASNRSALLAQQPRAQLQLLVSHATNGASSNTKRWWP
jgi:hypothetical protein